MRDRYFTENAHPIYGARESKIDNVGRNYS